jgi:BirA family biotin operon repressor/biotin-[acetyl-CoA-carboxylase] ligase
LKFLVIGSGVNLSQTKEDFPEEIRERASSVFLESGRVISRDELLRVYLGHLWDALEKLEAKKFSELVENYSEWDIIRGKEIRLMMVEKEIVGIVSGIDERGRLKVKSEGKEMIFFAGEINMLRGV